MIVVLQCMLVLIYTQHAFILSSSVGFYNYRQTAGALKVYEHLKQRGFRDNNIFLGIGQNTVCCEKNNQMGTISFEDNDYTNINNQVQIDANYHNIDALSIANSLRLKFEPSTPNKNKIEIKANEPFLVYLTGHGGDYYFKIRERQALTSEHFNKIFRDFFIRYPSNPILILSDSCSAITPFERIKEKNLISLGSSSFGQKSMSHGYDILLNSPKSDDFTFYFDQLLKDISIKNSKITLKQLANYMDISKLKVHSKLVSLSKQLPNSQLSNWITRTDKIQSKSSKIKWKKV